MGSRYKHGGFIGDTEQPEHYIWRSMLRRCEATTDKAFPYYGGRGIAVCTRWHEYQAFLADMGKRPLGMSLDRINNDGPYSPENCRWASASQQQKNKRTTWFYEQNGVVKTASEWAAELGISNQLAHFRWKYWGTFVRGQQWQRRRNRK